MPSLACEEESPPSCSARTSGRRGKNKTNHASLCPHCIHLLHRTRINPFVMLSLSLSLNKTHKRGACVLYVAKCRWSIYVDIIMPIAVTMHGYEEEEEAVFPAIPFILASPPPAIPPSFFFPSLLLFCQEREKGPFSVHLCK